MFTSVSGLGRLFSAAAQSLPPHHGGKSTQQPDSLIEETTTHDLLFPTLANAPQSASPYHQSGAGVDATYRPFAAQAADDRSCLDGQSIERVRVIVAQRADVTSRILFDSQPPTSKPHVSARPTSPSASEFGIAGYNDGEPRSKTLGRSLSQRPFRPHRRQSSLSQAAQSIFTSSLSPIPSTTDLGGLIGSSSQSRAQADRLMRPSSSAETESAISKSAREEKEETDDIVKCMFGSPGFLPASSTKIHVRPYSPRNDAVATSIPTSTSGTATLPLSPRKQEPRRPLLPRSNTAESINRLSGTNAWTDSHGLRRVGSYILVTKLFNIELGADEVRQLTEDAKRNTSGLEFPFSTLKQAKWPTYAVGMVLYTGSTNQRFPTPSSPSNRARFSSYPLSHSLGSLPELDRQLQQQGEFEKQVEQVIERWPNLLRSLAAIELVAETEIKSMFLAKLTVFGMGGDRNHQLEGNALQDSKTVHKSAEATERRVFMALKIALVVTGQERWALWKNVARSISVSKSLTEGSRKLLIVNMMTTFLSTHLEWLSVAAPRRYRFLQAKQKEEDHEEVKALTARTIIVCPNKMLARRLVFLLSLFLPSDPKHQALIAATDGPDSNQHWTSSPPARPSFSNDSFRRSIRAGGSVHFSDKDSFAIAPDDTNSLHRVATAPNPTHSRRGSDTGSIRSLAMPIAATARARKPSTTGNATVMVHAQEAVPLFTHAPKELALGTPAGPRPGSSGSFAAISLQRTLSRTEESTDRSISSLESQRRGGFWGDRAGSSTPQSEDLISSTENLRLSAAFQNKLPIIDTERPTTAASSATSTTEPFSPITPHNAAPPRTITYNTPPEAFPLTLSVDEKDGVIDVKVPASMETSLSSSLALPRDRRASSFANGARTPIHAAHHAERNGASARNIASTAGWLRTFHPDFEVQAVRPYENLKRDVKYTMRIEANAPDLVVPNTTAWTNVNSSVVVDATNGTVTRLTLRRINALSKHHQANALLGFPGDPTEEQFVEEIMSNANHDDAFTEVLDRLLWQTSTHSSSRVGTRPSSPTKGLSVDLTSPLVQTRSSPLSVSPTPIHKLSSASTTPTPTLVEHASSASTQSAEPVKIASPALTKSVSNSAASSSSPTKHFSRQSHQNHHFRRPSSTAAGMVSVGLSNAECRRLLFSALARLARYVSEDLENEIHNGDVDPLNSMANDTSLGRADVSPAQAKKNVLRTGIRRWMLGLRVLSQKRHCQPALKAAP